MKPCFAAVVLCSDIRLAGQALKTSVHTKLVETFRGLDQPPPPKKRIPHERVISTRSNLKGAVLKEIVATLGLDYSHFELKEKPIIDRLVKYRNSIAHGGGRPVTQADYAELHTEIIALMDVYKDLIEDAAASDQHLVA